jgi:hypothetical protein
MALLGIIWRFLKIYFWQLSGVEKRTREFFNNTKEQKKKVLSVYVCV